MTEREPEETLERGADELDERLDKLEEHIDEAKDKAEAVRPEDPEKDDLGPASEQYPPQFDRDAEQD